MAEWRCKYCEYVWRGNAPAQPCPNCASPAEQFEREFEKGREEEQRTDLSRRRFLGTLGWGSFAISAAFALGASLRYLIPNVLFESPRKVKVGRPEDFIKGTRTFVESGKLFVIRDEKGFRAASGVCTHLGCTVQWRQEQQEFHCPCHGSKYHADGTRFAGPAPRSLDWFHVTLDMDGWLIVHKDRIVQPDKVLIA